MKNLSKILALLAAFMIQFSFLEGYAQSQSKDRDIFGLYVQRGLTKTSDNLMDGYAIFVAANSPYVYLVNRKGEVVHQWKSDYFSEAVPYLNNDGSIYLMVEDPDFPVFHGGGAAGRIEKISWDSKTLWDFEYATEDHLAHHDIAVLPSGNLLSIAWESHPADEVLQAGRKPELTPKAGLWTSRIVEIQPTDKTHGKVVWEWHLWDHLIQDFDKTKDNYGDVAAHPELLDFNIGEKVSEPKITQDSLDVLVKLHKASRNSTNDNRGSDAFHLNAVYYNDDLDQIAFSSADLSEVFIIDHSTTSEEAAGHIGGRWGKGGDFLYRWGNPQNYRQGDSTDQQSHFQHDFRWIDKGYPGEGSMTLFNDQVPGIHRKDSLDYSAIYQIKPSIDADGNYILMENKRFGPEKPEWKYIAKDTISFYAPFVSGAQRMKNGNTFITEGPKGRIFEVTPEGEIVWEYLNPYHGDIRYLDGDPKQVQRYPYFVWRAHFVPADHPGLKGKELVPFDPQPEVFKLPPKEEKKEKSE